MNRIRARQVTSQTATRVTTRIQWRVKSQQLREVKMSILCCTSSSRLLKSPVMSAGLSFRKPWCRGWFRLPQYCCHCRGCTIWLTEELVLTTYRLVFHLLQSHPAAAAAAAPAADKYLTQPHADSEDVEEFFPSLLHSVKYIRIQQPTTCTCTLLVLPSPVLDPQGEQLRQFNTQHRSTCTCIWRASG